MSLIAMQSPETATGEVARIYSEMQQMMGSVPNAMRIFSLNPLWLRQQWDYIGYYMNHPNLSFPLLAVVRMLTSVGHSCAYCVDLNTGLLIQMAGWTPEQVAATRANLADAPLAAREKALIRLVLQAVDDSNSITAANLDELRGMGWSGGDILDAVNHGARQLAADVVFNTFKIERDA